MATAPNISNVAAKAAADAIRLLLDAGSPPGLLKIYKNDNTPTVPVNADDALNGATLLATLTLGNPAFGAATDGNGKATITANAITSAAAVATGTAAFFRATNAAGTSVIQGTVGTATSDLVLNAVDITSGATVAVTAWTFNVPEHA